MTFELHALINNPNIAKFIKYQIARWKPIETRIKRSRKRWFRIYGENPEANGYPKIE